MFLCGFEDQDWKDIASVFRRLQVLWEFETNRIFDAARKPPSGIAHCADPSTRVWPDG